MLAIFEDTQRGEGGFVLMLVILSTISNACEPCSYSNGF